MTTRSYWIKNKEFLQVLTTCLVAGAILASCNTKPTPSPDAQIRAAVAATLASIPSPTPYSLEGTFCEYGFCIGHPQDFYLIDQGATRQA